MFCYTTIIQLGHVSLRHLYNIQARTGSPYHHVHMDAEARVDLLWWEKFLQTWNGTMFFRQPPTPAVHVCYRRLRLVRRLRPMSTTPLLPVAMAYYLVCSWHCCQGVGSGGGHSGTLGWVVAPFTCLLPHRQWGGCYHSTAIWQGCDCSTPSPVFLFLFSFLSVLFHCRTYSRCINSAADALSRDSLTLFSSPSLPRLTSHHQSWTCWLLSSRTGAQQPGSACSQVP